MISFIVAALAVGWLARGRASQLALDKPNARSLHAVPVPRTGGLGLLLGIAASWFIIAPKLSWTWWMALALVIVVSLTDDLRGLHASARLGAHLLAATLAAFALLPTDTAPWLIAAVILGIGWLGNLYNFMDGSDGLAGGMALIGFGTYAAASYFAGSTQFALMNLAIALAAGGFLLHNFHPARIFMGDAGAVTLGFLAATQGLIGWLQRDWTWWFPLLVFSPFIVDASTTLARRTADRARIWQAHRDHYYQRLVQLGWGHRRTALVEYGLMTFCGATALAGLRWSPVGQLALLLAVTMLYVLIIGLIEIAWRKHQAEKAHEA